jgi:hypothetical protein
MESIARHRNPTAACFQMVPAFEAVSRRGVMLKMRRKRGTTPKTADYEGSSGSSRARGKRGLRVVVAVCYGAATYGAHVMFGGRVVNWFESSVIESSLDRWNSSMVED